MKFEPFLVHTANMAAGAQKHKAPRQLGFRPYPFRDMTHRRVAERGVQYLLWVCCAMPATWVEGLGICVVITFSLLGYCEGGNGTMPEPRLHRPWLQYADARSKTNPRGLFCSSHQEFIGTTYIVGIGGSWRFWQGLKRQIHF